MKCGARFRTALFRPFVACLLVLPVCEGARAWEPGTASPVPGGSPAGNYYDYAPCSVLDAGVEYHFYCTSPQWGDVRDHIGLTRVNHADGTVLAAKQLVLGPSEGDAWDSLHTCDPTVVKGTFADGGTAYSWAMFYLGEDAPPEGCCTHNQIGVAFARDLTGPWVKWGGNPLVSFGSYDYWGVGQPSAVSLDKGGRVALFYTRGDQAGTRVLRRDLDLSDLSAPTVGEAVRIPHTGLTSRDGSPVIFHNAAFALDRARDRLVVTRPRHPFDGEVPSFVSSELEVAAINSADLARGTGAWEVLGHINASHSGKPRNHNSGFLRDGFGALPDSGELEVVFAASDTGNAWLWSYRLYRIQGEFAGDVPVPHTADTDGDWAIGLSELLRVVQIHAAAGYHCDPLSEDGYAPGPGNLDCGPRDEDFAPGDGRIQLNELLRVIQFHNSTGISRCTGSEDGFCTAAWGGETP